MRIREQPEQQSDEDAQGDGQLPAHAVAAALLVVRCRVLQAIVPGAVQRIGGRLLIGGHQISSKLRHRPGAARRLVELLELLGIAVGGANGDEIGWRCSAGRGSCDVHGLRLAHGCSSNPVAAGDTCQTRLIPSGQQRAATAGIVLDALPVGNGIMSGGQGHP
jgi:hypothetical protein